MKSVKLFVLFLCLAWLSSCNKDDFTFNPNVKLAFSTDTISFDTIFTSFGSVTKYFTVVNDEDLSVKISDIQLAGGENSPFRLNINGTKSNQLSDLILEANDSIYIFVEVIIDPNGQDLPMVVNDSIVFETNGNMQSVNLIAFGQDVHLLNGNRIQTGQWTNDKPYLVYNSVLIDSLQTLTIDPGCRIHFHKGSSLLVYGTLKAIGTYEEPILFGGDRLENQYENIPGQWGLNYVRDEGALFVFGGIHFLQGSGNNELNHVIIRNAHKGIQLDSMGFTPEPMLRIFNSRIENMTLNCIYAQTSSIEAGNCVFANSGSYSVALALGGNYRFSHCTFANYFQFTSKAYPALLLNNYFEYGNKIYSYDMLASFGNSIFYGTKDLQIRLDEKPGGKFTYLFKNCLIQSGDSENAEGNGFSSCLFGQDPHFLDPVIFNFNIDSLSPARNIGNVEIARLFPFDLSNNSRLADEGPDLGALEWMPED